MEKFSELGKNCKKIKRNLERFLRTLEIKTELGKKELGNINRTWKFKPSLAIKTELRNVNGTWKFKPSLEISTDLGNKNGAWIYKPSLEI